MAKRLSIKPMPKDHPIYKRGFVIGGRISRASSVNTQEKALGNEAKKSGENEPKEDKK